MEQPTSAFQRFLFASFSDYGIALLRVSSGILLFANHGLGKLLNFEDKAAGFYDPFGLGGEFSLSLVIFAEVFCALLTVVGLVTRLALVPLIITMAVAFFGVHGGDPIGQRELPLFFLLSYVVLLITGPGRVSLDHVLFRRTSKMT